MPTAEQLGFWAAIRAAPDDDTPRLVYADWLQENGDADRAEFIRLQCEIARLPDDRKTQRKVRPALEHREKVLLTANRPRWAEPTLQLFRDAKLPGMRDRHLNAVRFARGFVYGLVLDLDGAYRLVKVSELEPVAGVTVAASVRALGDTKKIAAIAEWEHAGCFGVLSLREPNDEEAKLVARGRLTRLSELSLWNGTITDVGAAELAAWPGGAHLTRLNLVTNRIGDAGARALAESPFLTGLHQLDLRQNPIGADGEYLLTFRLGADVVLLH